MSRQQIIDNVKAGLIIGFITSLFTGLTMLYIMRTELAFLKEDVKEQGQICSDRYNTLKNDVHRLESIDSDLTTKYTILEIKKQDKPGF